MYKAIHKQTGEIKKGSWDQLCDLDKRIWTLEKVLLSKLGLWPLCVLEVLQRQFYSEEEGGGYTEYFYLKRVYSLKDLEGVYI